MHHKREDLSPDPSGGICQRRSANSYCSRERTCSRFPPIPKILASRFWKQRGRDCHPHYSRSCAGRMGANPPCGMGGATGVRGDRPNPKCFYPRSNCRACHGRSRRPSCTGSVCMASHHSTTHQSLSNISASNANASTQSITRTTVL